MSEKIRLLCWVYGDELNRVFRVEIKPSDGIAELKKVIRAEKQSFKDIDADTLELWRVVRTAHNSADFVELEDGRLLEPGALISDYWKEQPSSNVLSVVLPRPAVTTITPYTSQDNPQGSMLWLVEIHKKLWRRRDLFDQVFRTVNLTSTHFIELQHNLHALNPSRSSESYVARDILTTQADFLRPRSFADSKSAAHFANYTATSDLVPQLVVDTSEDLTPPTAADVVEADAADDTDVLDVGNVDFDPMDESGVSADPGSSNIFADAARLSEGPTAIFPCTARYIDLTCLNLKHLDRVPHLMRIGDEWRVMMDFFNRRKTGIQGSAVLTGQPGIGKTCLLYYILILCLIRGQPILFQDMKGEVFFIKDEVSRLTDENLAIACEIDIPSNELLALVDADGKFCQPNPGLLTFRNVRILFTSPPRSRTDRKWLTQSIKNSTAVYIMEPWSRKEFLLTSLFLAGIDITLTRFYQTTHICGYIPRQCFIYAIKGTGDLASAVVKGHPLHRAFEIFPGPDIRNYESYRIRPISDWVLSQVMAELDNRGLDSFYNFYKSIQRTRGSAAFVRKVFESKFFQSITGTEPRHFTIYALDDPSTTFHITFSSYRSHQTFFPIQQFAGHLASSVNASQSIYLRPLSLVFPTFDSSLYQHDLPQPRCQPLIALQMTTAKDHPVSIKGLANVQASLEPQIPTLEALRPTLDKKIILLVVPLHMAASLVTQRMQRVQPGVRKLFNMFSNYQKKR